MKLDETIVKLNAKQWKKLIELSGRLHASHHFGTFPKEKREELKQLIKHMCLIEKLDALDDIEEGK